MLLQFVVENFKSFQSEAVLNLAPSKSRIHRDHILSDNAQGRAVEALPLAVFYGANASGKSTLIQAMAVAQNLIVQGTRGEEPIAVVPFKLDPTSLKKPTRFEFVVKHEGVLYTYGFQALDTIVEEEWLFAVYKSREVKVFERVTKDGKAIVECGRSVAPNADEAQRIRFVAEGTRPNQLFLTEANERNVEALKPLMRWFRSNLRIIFPQSESTSESTDIVFRAHTDQEFARFLAEFLRVADTGIEGISTSAERLDVERPISGMPKDSGGAMLGGIVKSMLGEIPNFRLESLHIGAGGKTFMIKPDSEKGPTLISLKTRHRTTAQETVDFETLEESDGTRRMMHLVPALLDLQSDGKVYVIDELDRSMHPLLCRLYVEAFLRGIRGAGCRGQLIVTTHETSLLEFDLLRRDEIWFLEKDKQGGSHLTSLAEYQVRKDLKIDKGYLHGRFGAIPYIGDINRLFPRK